MNVNHLQPGRELDVLIADKVMGGYESKTIGFITYPGSESSLEARADFDKVPHYSTDIAAAWEVVKKLTFIREPGRIYKPVIRLEFFEHDGPYECRIGRCKSIVYDDDIVATAEERNIGEGRTADEMTVAMCLAICRAALKAVGA
jgi:hypothetical protein